MGASAPQDPVHSPALQTEESRTLEQIECRARLVNPAVPATATSTLTAAAGSHSVIDMQPTRHETYASYYYRDHRTVVDGGAST